MALRLCLAHPTREWFPKAIICGKRPLAGAGFGTERRDLDKVD